MMIPATLIINMGDYTTLTPFIAVIELVIPFSNAFLQLYCHSCRPYLFLAFRYDGDHFLLQYLHNSTMDFKIVR